MRIRGNIKSDFRMFCFQFKNIRKVFFIPIMINLIGLPLVLFASMKRYQDIYYVEEALMLFGQYVIPILSTWWFSFAFIEFIDNEGNELYYVNHKMKNRLLLLWLGLYLAITGIEYGVIGIWTDIALLELIRVAICSCFYVALEYAVMFLSGSMTLSFLVIILYWMMSALGGEIKVNWLNCFDNNFMTMNLLTEKYVWIMILAIVFYLTGCLGNARKEKYN